MNLSKDIKLAVVAQASAAAQTAVNSGIVDTQGYDGVMFVAVVDSATINSVIGLKAQQNTLNQTGGMADITNAATPAYTALGTEAGVGFAVDVFRPQQRYVRAVLSRTAANAVVDTIVAILYRGLKKPSVQDASILASTLVVPTA